MTYNQIVTWTAFAILAMFKTGILTITGMLMDVTSAWRKGPVFRTMLPATLFTLLLIHLTSTSTASMRIEVVSPMPPIKEPMGSQFMLQVVVRLDMLMPVPRRQ